MRWTVGNGRARVIAAAAATAAVVAACVVSFGLLREDTVRTSAAIPRPAAAASSPVPSADPAATPAVAAPPAKSSVPARPSPSRTATKAAPPARSAAKKGVGVWDFPAASAGLKAVGASWYYNWGPSNDRMPGPAGVEFVPMVWGAANVTDGTLAKVKGKGRTLLGFNEPDMAEQANMTPARALELWPRLQATGMRLGSPAVAWGAADSGRWLDQFMAGAEQRGYRVDFIALHWYGSDFSAAAVGHLKSYLRQVYAKYRLPIWLTEFALIKWDASGAHYPADAQQAAFIDGATRMLQGLSYVERYAWFGLPATAGSGTGLYRASGSLTPAGQAYRAAG
jgi:hypothetical protein